MRSSDAVSLLGVIARSQHAISSAALALLHAHSVFRIEKSDASPVEKEHLDFGRILLLCNIFCSRDSLN